MLIRFIAREAWKTLRNWWDYIAPLIMVGNIISLIFTALGLITMSIGRNDGRYPSNAVDLAWRSFLVWCITAGVYVPDLWNWFKGKRKEYAEFIRDNKG